MIYTKMQEYNIENKHNLIQMNRYCNDFHDNDRIIFCKIDYILQEFERISKSNKSCVLIIANGDITFNDDLLKRCPSNVKHIFSTNTTCYTDFVTPIPIGVEMDTPAKRNGHGDINQGIFEKLPFLTSEQTETIIKTSPNKLYSNFNIFTNYYFRNTIKSISTSSPNIHFENGLTYSDFVKQVKNHYSTISPRGNGIECIRTYEVLYLNEIPIVVGDYNEYRAINDKIYSKLPVLFISDFNKLSDMSYIENQIKNIETKSREGIYYDYWYDVIMKKIKSVI